MTFLRLFPLLPILLASVSAESDQEVELATRQWLLVVDTSGSYPVWTVIDVNQQADLSSLASFSPENHEYSILLHEVWEALNLRIEGGLQMSIPAAKGFKAPAWDQVSAERKFPFGIEEVPQLFSSLQECFGAELEIRLSLSLGPRSLLQNRDRAYIPMNEWGVLKPLDSFPEYYGGYWRGPATAIVTEGDAKQSAEFILHLASTLADHLGIQPHRQHDLKQDPLWEEVLRMMGHRNPKVVTMSLGGVLIQSSPPVITEVVDPDDPFGPKIKVDGSVHDYHLGEKLLDNYYTAVALAKMREQENEMNDE